MNDNNTIPLENVLVENSTYSRTALKRRLYKEGIKQRKCELCGQGEEWQGKRMSLILDHINGMNNDNRLPNLRIVCPNCNATLETHAGRNSAKPKRRNCCADCDKLISAQAKWCTSCSKRHYPTQEHIKRPPQSQLTADIEKLGYRGTGRKYGVSDTTIRKWMIHV